MLVSGRTGMTTNGPQTTYAVRNAWYCAALSHELRADRPLGRRVLDQPLALFRDQAGAPCALAAVCPHRGADLSRGKLCAGQLACPMHGWQFDREGDCVRIPSQPSEVRVASRVRVRSFELREAQGIVWIWMGDATAATPPPQYDVWEHTPTQRRAFDRPRLWRCSFVNAVENALDIAHAPFVHSATLGSAQPELVARQRIELDAHRRGFRGEDDPSSAWRADRGSGIPGGLAGWIARLLGIGEIRQQYYRFDLGGSVFFYIEYDNGTWDVLFGHATPCDERHTWFFGGTVRTRALHPLGDLFQRRFMTALSDEDELEVTTMGTNEPGNAAILASAAADEGTLAFRRLWEVALAQETKRRSLKLLDSELKAGTIEQEGAIHALSSSRVPASEP